MKLILTKFRKLFFLLILIIIGCKSSGDILNQINKDTRLHLNSVFKTESEKAMLIYQDSILISTIKWDTDNKYNHLVSIRKVLFNSVSSKSNFILIEKAFSQYTGTANESYLFINDKIYYNYSIVNTSEPNLKVEEISLDKVPIEILSLYNFLCSDAKIIKKNFEDDFGNYILTKHRNGLKYYSTHTKYLVKGMSPEEWN